VIGSCCNLSDVNSWDSDISSSSGSSCRVRVSSEVLSGRAEFLGSTIDAVIAVLQGEAQSRQREQPQGSWRVTEGYLLVVEALLLRLLAAEVRTLRRKAQRGAEGAGAQSSTTLADKQQQQQQDEEEQEEVEDEMFLSARRLVPPLILHSRALARHPSFEVRRITSQLLPSLARTATLCPEHCDATEDSAPDIMAGSMEGGGECLPCAVFLNERLRGVIHLREVQREIVRRQVQAGAVVAEQQQQQEEDKEKEVHAT
jgi:hypothetical protein